MNIDELIKYRSSIIEESKNEDKTLTEEGFLSVCIPLLLDAKLVDSEDYSLSRFEDHESGAFVSAFHVNESSERLQIFAADYEKLFTSKEEDFIVSRKTDYDRLFKGMEKFVELSVKNHIEPQDSDGSGFLVSKLQSPDYLDQFEVIELFVLTPSCSISKSGGITNTKTFSFEDSELNVRFTKAGEREQNNKSLLIIKRLIDINLLYQINISQGNRHPLEVDLTRDFGSPVTALLAADEENFESFLCVLPAEGLANLYKRESSRLLEKNVRSFLQFRGVNKGMRETIRTEPERFIAYNNGLTITATGVDKTVENGVIKLNSLQDFQIVNGGQTTASIFFARKEGLDVSHINLMAKINVAKKISEEELNDLISNISLYSNSQSRVSKVDLNSRNNQLNMLKAMSTSVITPGGNKWFFEKSKGEFNTMLRLAGSARKRKEKEFPKQRRFSKELLGKYFVAWGEVPYMVKLGGEKVFRTFLEMISGDGDKVKPAKIDRDFYEDTIARVIMFRELERLHGQGNNAIGQLRSAVVPYSMSVLYVFSKGKGKKSDFNLQKVWRDEGLSKELEVYMRELMILMNDLIKKYASSDDYGQYSKKAELWDAIIESKEIKTLREKRSTQMILDQYMSSEIKSDRVKKDIEPLNFEALVYSAEVMDRGRDFYLRLKNEIVDRNENLSGYSNLLVKVLERMRSFSLLDEKTIASLDSLTHDLLRYYPDELEKLLVSMKESGFGAAVDQIVEEYNKYFDTKGRVKARFMALEQMALKKGLSHSSIFGQIGELLEKGELPDLKMVSYTVPYFTGNNGDGSSSIEKKDRIEKITVELIRELIEWGSRKDVYNRGELAVLTGVAYLGKPLNERTVRQIEPLVIKARKVGFSN